MYIHTHRLQLRPLGASRRGGLGAPPGRLPQGGGAPTPL